MSVYAPRSSIPTFHLDGHLSGQPTRDSDDASSVSSLLGLAPGRGCLAACITANAGGLLHRLFTLTALRRLAVSVALSGKLPRPGVSPGPCSMECGLSSAPHLVRGRDRPVDLRRFHHTCSWNHSQPQNSSLLPRLNDGRGWEENRLAAEGWKYWV